MRKIFTLAMAMTMCMCMLASANAQVSAGPTSAGDPITITPTAANIPGAQPLVFKPSPQVVMSYYSNFNGFSLNAVHNAAIETPGGQAYGMASDTNKVYWVSVEAEGSALVAVATASSVEFEVTQATYNPMN